MSHRASDYDGRSSKAIAVNSLNESLNGFGMYQLHAVDYLKEIRLHFQELHSNSSPCYSFDKKTFSLRSHRASSCLFSYAVHPSI
jgi:hypothetical protein